jgi:magnesium transporter
MLHILPTPGDHKIAEPSLVTTDALWLDLLNPTSAEVTSVEEAIGAKLPTLGALSEIESSSRLRSRGGILYMSTPSPAGRREGAQTTPPLGFVLSTDRLVTVRFMPLPAFDAVVRKFASSHDAPKSSLKLFTLLREEIVDHVADILEQLAGELNGLSIDAFRADDTRGKHAARANRVLRVQLRQVGRLGDRFSEVRDGMQGLGRIVAYTDQYACERSGGALKPRLAGLRGDIHSLIEYEEQLSSKVQFVLDALVGLIGIAQNDVFKVLTIVSIVGIPQTSMAGIYGMNFKNMPEYDWAWGYQYGWMVIIISALIPLIWFKLKGWFRRPITEHQKPLAINGLAEFVAAEERAGGAALVAGGDRDSLQLASSSPSILYPSRGHSRIGPEEAPQRYGVDPSKCRTLSRSAATLLTNCLAPRSGTETRRGSAAAVRDA